MSLLANWVDIRPIFIHDNSYLTLCPVFVQLKLWILNDEKFNFIPWSPSEYYIKLNTINNNNSNAPPLLLLQMLADFICPLPITIVHCFYCYYSFIAYLLHRFNHFVSDSNRLSIQFIINSILSLNLKQCLHIFKYFSFRVFFFFNFLFMILVLQTAFDK